MSYDLRLAARRAVDDLRARAVVARRSQDDHLAMFLELQANRLEAPLLVEEQVERRRNEEAMAARLHIKRAPRLSAVVERSAETLRRLEDL